MPTTKTKKVLEEANSQLEKEVADQRKLIGEPLATQMVN